MVIPLEVVLFLVMAFALVGLLYWHARTRQRAGLWVGTPVTAQLTWLGTYHEAFQRVLDCLPVVEAYLLDADADRGTLLAGTEPSVLTLGHTLRIRLHTQDGVTFVELEAAPTLPSLDPGAPRRLLNRFLQAWERIPPRAPNAQPRRV